MHLCDCKIALIVEATISLIQVYRVLLFFRDIQFFPLLLLILLILVDGRIRPPMPHGQPVNYEITTFLRCFARERTTWHIALWEVSFILILNELQMHADCIVLWCAFFSFFKYLWREFYIFGLRYDNSDLVCIENAHLLVDQLPNMYLNAQQRYKLKGWGHPWRQSSI